MSFIRAFRPEKLIPPTETPAVGRFRSLGELPIDLEIGCGVGWHPIQYAQANPERVLVAIEQTTKKFTKFSARVQANARLGRSLENLIPIHADAVAWVTAFVPEQCLDRIILFYPNPNSKNPAARWIRMPFFGHLLTKLRPGGVISFRTNEPVYAEEVREYGSRIWGLSLLVDRSFSSKDTPLGEAVTHFERKYLEAGDTCFQIDFTKASLR